jgi:hypothetical protein
MCPVRRNGLAPRLLSPRLAQPGHGGAEADRLEIAVRIEKIIATVLYEAHEQQTGVVMDTLSEGPEGFYRSYLD